MCGIVGVAGTRDVAPIILEALKRLEYRGYDSAGIATLDGGMIARRRGHIVLMASLTGYVGLPTAASYGATKAALISVAQAFKPDFERFGVTISVINPGFVKTPLTDKNTFPMPFLVGTDEAIDHIMRGIDSGRFEISFPWQMSTAIRLLAWLPNWAKFAITRRMLPR